MNNLYLKQKGVLPGIFFNRESGKLEITGQCSPVNANLFFEPMMNWLDEYIKYPCETTELDIFLSYFNTMSAKNILQIMKKLEELSQSGKKVKIRWLHVEGDIDLMEAGIDFELIIDAPFEIVAVQE
jgi:hypothetical protein